MSGKNTTGNGQGGDDSDASELFSTVSTDKASETPSSNQSGVSPTAHANSKQWPPEESTMTHGVKTNDESALQIGQLLLDRFEIRKRLGKGGFGAVFAAYDRQLKRNIAIKQSRMLRSFVAGQVREEARAVASLNHPNIVQIHDLIQRSQEEWLIIMECLEGAPLSQRMHQSRMGIADTVRLSIEIADALIHAHERHLVHSDLKPANVFVCDNGRIKLLDFGLAIANFPDQDAVRIGGTPGYMSPEQIRGESHLIDGRTDLWAFGVVLYEMLTGVRPFAAKQMKATRSRTLFKSAAPPRQLNPDVDNELQRIILKCLEPLITSRYASAADLRDDLDHWLVANGNSNSRVDRQPHKSKSAIELVPSSLRVSNRGLQPFTENDAEIYLSIIPGSRDRKGIPDSIRFWKRWVESDDPNTEHPVGVLYGPSGSGKTSYVRAGLFQQLPDEICRVYVECRPGNLGGRLTRIIESQINVPSTESSLRDLLHRLRSGESGSRGFRKLLIVLDQFESWALSATLEERLDLAEALRQCDGFQIRALVVTRDDYWTGVNELLHWLEIPMREGRNVASVELLDTNQAEQILELIGRESGTLPADNQSLSKEQRQFITQSVHELEVDGKVICVHLVMFAKMVKMQDWTPRALRENNGVSGACSLFFHELFGKSGRTSPQYKRIAPVVPAILRQLIPSESDTVAEVCIDYQSLARAVEQCEQAHLIDDCLQLLDEDLRIITAVDTDVSEDSSSASNEKRLRDCQYRLSHDFLVEPIKVYLARTQRENWRSRTMARLVEMSDLWSRRHNVAYLPGFSEYLILAFGTFFQPRSETESRFLGAATRLHAGRISAALLAFLGFLFMSFIAWNQWSTAKDARQGQLRANVARLLDCEPEKLADQVRTLEGFGQAALEEVSVWNTSQDRRVRLRANLFSQFVSGETFSEIGQQIGEAPSQWFELVLDVAKKTPDAVAVLDAIAEKGVADEANPEVTVERKRLGDRAAILLAYLGDQKALLIRLAGSDDLARDQAFLSETITWRGRPRLWAELVRNSSDADVCYHAGIVLAGYPGSELRNSDVQFDFPSLINSPHASTHSIARFLANHLSEDVTSTPLQPPENADWRVGPYGIPMVRFEPKDFIYRPSQSTVQKEDRADVSYSVIRSFWCATTPVSEQMYRDFAADLKRQGSEFETNRSLDRFNLPDYLVYDPSQPAVILSIDQAVMFCNWLSRQEQMNECYTRREIDPKDETGSSLPPILWTFDETANGYRLPTKAEFHLTAYCGYLHPDNTHAIELAVAAGYPRMTPPRPREMYALIPNRSGIFQMDPWCGTWICGDANITYFSLGERGTIMDLQREHFVPVAGVFLCQNEAAK